MDCKIKLHAFEYGGYKCSIIRAYSIDKYKGLELGEVFYTLKNGTGIKQEYHGFSNEDLIGGEVLRHVLEYIDMRIGTGE